MFSLLASFDLVSFIVSFHGFPGLFPEIIVPFHRFLVFRDPFPAVDPAFGLSVRDRLLNVLFGIVALMLNGLFLMNGFLACSSPASLFGGAFMSDAVSSGITWRRCRGVWSRSGRGCRW
jgi:hypothetical protein